LRLPVVSQQEVVCGPARDVLRQPAVLGRRAYSNPSCIGSSRSATAAASASTCVPRSTCSSGGSTRSTRTARKPKASNLEGGKIVEEHEAGRAARARHRLHGEPRRTAPGRGQGAGWSSSVTNASSAIPKCPYVPPHEFAVDFPRLMLRGEDDRGEGGTASPGASASSAPTDLVGGGVMTKIASARQRRRPQRLHNRMLMEKTLGIAKDRQLPTTAGGDLRHLVGPARAGGERPRRRSRSSPPCFVNFNDPGPHRQGRRRGCWRRRAATSPARSTSAAGCRSWTPATWKARASWRGGNVERLLPAVREGRKIVFAGPSCTLLLAHGVPRARPHPRGSRGGGRGDDLSDFVLHQARGEEAAQARGRSGGEGSPITSACHKPGAELRIPRARICSSGAGGGRHPGRPLLRHGRNLGDEERILRRRA